MNLKYSGKLTKEEYLAYLKLCNRPILKKNSSYLDVWILFFFAGVIISLTGLVTFYLQRNSSGSSSLPWVLTQFVIGIVLIALGLKFRGAISRFWEENKDVISIFNGMVSDDAVEMFTPNGSLKVNWSELTGYGEYKDLIVLFKPPVFAIPFLERFFESQEDWLAFRKVVVSKLALTHQVDQGTHSKRNIVYVLLSIALIIVYLYIFVKSR